MSFTTIIIVCLALTSVTLGDQCPKFVTQNPFNITRYLGFWYEAYRSDILFEIGDTCSNATYTANSDGTVGVWNQAVNIVGDYVSIRGSAKVKNASEPAAFVVTFNKQKGDYNVLSSNYVDYSLVYACEIIPVIEKKAEFIWILSRTKTVSESVVDELKKILSDIGANVKSLTKVTQNC